MIYSLHIGDIQTLVGIAQPYWEQG